MREYAIAFDPGVKTGIAVWNRRSRSLISTHTSDFFGAVGFLRQVYPDQETVLVLVEQPPDFLYARNKVWLAHKDERERDSILFNIGGNVREAKLLTQAITLEGYKVKSVPPVLEKKWDQKRFRLQFKGVRGHVTQHEIDAARLALVYG